MTQENEQWKDVLNLLKGQISTPSFDTWFRQTRAIIDGNRWLIIAPNEFNRDWLDGHYLLKIKEAIYQISNKSFDVEVIMEDQNTGANQPDININNILERIELLKVNEREKLLSILKHRYEDRAQKMNSEQETVPIEEIDIKRMVYLENDLKYVKEHCEKLESQVNEIMEKLN